MGLALAIVLIWAGIACLWVALHGTDAVTPWGAYSSVIDTIRGEGS